MSRKPYDPIEPEVLPGAVPGHAITLAEEAAVKEAEQDMISMAMQDIGSLRAFEFIRKISGRAQVEIYLRQVKTKAYKAVSYTNAEGQTEKFPDIDTFCTVYLGESGRNLRNKASNYHLLGAELFEVSERLGFKGRDYTALKALPADDQDAIKAAMATGDRDQILDLMQELAVRHASEKAELTAKAAEAECTAEARSEVIAAKETTINALEEANHKLRRRVETATPDEVTIEIRKEADVFAFRAEHAISSDLRKAFNALAEQGGQHSEYMLGLITQIELAASVLRADFGLLKAGPDGDPTPYWERNQQPAVN